MEAHQVEQRIAAGDQGQGSADRDRWLAVLERIARPVLEAAGERRLKATMPLELSEGGVPKPREAVGRLLFGIAPWLELPQDVGGEHERALRKHFVALAREAIRGGTDPQSPDLFTTAPGRPEPLVDAAHLCLAILRAPNALWAELDAGDRAHVLAFLRRTRRFMPHWNNWLLFAGAVETLLLRVGEDDADELRIDYALRQHEQWYLGDGVYGDGPVFVWDHYNSLVMHPFLVDMIDVAAAHSDEWKKLQDPIMARAGRYAQVQERLISPEGTYPPIGRSLAYRFGALQSLAQASLRELLPDSLPPGQVRAAMTAVLGRQMEAPGTFDADGWLTIGFAGHQPSIGDRYIVTGSLYLCTAGLLPLGLAPEHPFWSDPPEPWTAARIWSGQDVPRDHALEEGPLDRVVP